MSRLSLLLDRDPKLVSFQTLYTKLQSETVVTLLLKRLDDNEFSISRTAELAKDSVQCFLQTYRSIDWRGLHGRLVHFRNRGVAHLTPQKIEKRVSYAELKTLSLAVAIRRHRTRGRGVPAHRRTHRPREQDCSRPPNHQGIPATTSSARDPLLNETLHHPPRFSKGTIASIGFSHGLDPERTLPR